MSFLSTTVTLLLRVRTSLIFFASEPMCLVKASGDRLSGALVGVDFVVDVFEDIAKNTLKKSDAMQASGAKGVGSNATVQFER